MGSFALNRGITLANFISEGNTPLVIDIFKIYVRSPIRLGYSALIIAAYIESHTGLLCLISVIMEVTSVALTLWGRVTHICVGNLTITGSDNGLSPGRRQAIIWTNAGILLTGHLRTKFIEILIEIHIISLKKSHLKMSSGKRRDLFGSSRPYIYEI